MGRRRLGRGLDALIPAPVERAGEVREIPLDLLDPNPYQPRKEVEDEELKDLARSIKEHGVVQPVVVRPKGERFELVVGERRWRAAMMAGLKAIPAIVREVGEREMVEMALVENLQRKNLNPVEQAEAYKRLREEFGLTQEEIAKRIGKTRAAVANTLRLLQLPQEILESLRRGEITEGHARAILGAGTKERMLSVWRAVLERKLSVRGTESLVRSMTAPRRRRGKDPNVVEAERRLSERLGSPVRITVDEKGRGSLTVRLFSWEDLERIMEAFGA
ncbi:MAG TPA: ParB/RepB/Spo0J family partition protein [Armatimonadetes bacterium]|nr:ParB/RepB/Spo0J family partition protein [Armatimonadota bacterium]